MIEHPSAGTTAIVHANQFFTADDVASALGEISVGPPLNGTLTP